MTTPAVIGAANGPVRISVGMCAFNEEKHIAAALESLLSQQLSEPFILREVLVVASGCTDRTEVIVREWSRRDPRILLLREPSRTGKARALSWILKEATGDVLVNLNADARLGDGALASLVSLFARDAGLMLACGAPFIPNGSSSPVLCTVELLWRLHNRTLEALSIRGLPNHCCDEFMALRRGFVEALPEGLMNDGAYLGALASVKGASVLFCPDARVLVDPPATLKGFIRRRQTILRGHEQVREILHEAPNTLKNLARERPGLAAKIVVRELFADARSLFTGLLLLFPLEGLAAVIARLERLRGRTYEPIWTPAE